MLEEIKVSRLAALIILVVTTSALVLAYTPGLQHTVMYSVDNEDPYGLSEAYKIFSSRLETKTVVGSISSLLRENVSRSALLIVGPYKTFSSDELSSILFLLARGNSLIIANDFGSANQILTVISYLLYEMQKREDPNATVYIKRIAFNGSVLMDAVSYVENPAEPLVTNILHDQDPLGIFDGVDKIATYMPTTITAYVEDRNKTAEYRTPLPGQALTTQYSRLETDMKSVKDGTYKPDSDERGGIPFSVILYYPLSDNQFIMLVGDPDIFSNRYLNDPRFDNRKLVENLAEVLAEKVDVLYIDQSHDPALPIAPQAYLSIVLRTIAYFTLFPIISLFVPLSIYSYLKKMFPEYEARGILLKRARRRTAYEFNPEARKALERNDFKEPLKLLLERFRVNFERLYGSRSIKALRRVASRRKVPKKHVKTIEEALKAVEKGEITRDEFVLYARSINEVSKLLGMRRYVRGEYSTRPAA